MSVCCHGTPGCPDVGEKHMCLTGHADVELQMRMGAVVPQIDFKGVTAAGESIVQQQAPQTRVEDPINPAHYKKSPSGIEVIEITRHLSFNLGNVVKYVLRAGHKTPDPIEDLRKAAWYLNDEIKRLEKK